MRSHLLKAAALAAFQAGCGGDGRPVPVPVEGVVLVDGQPAAGARVCFYSDEPWNQPWKLVPVGMAGEDGRFELQTYQPGDGAPPGSYTVSVVWMAAKPGKADEEMTAKADRLRGAAANPKTSGLTAVVLSDGGSLALLEIRTKRPE